MDASDATGASNHVKRGLKDLTGHSSGNGADTFPHFKYAAFDLDGTLLDQAGHAPPDVTSGISRLKQQGLRCYIVSGRRYHRFRALQLSARLLALFEPAVLLSDGDVIWDSRRGSVNIRRALPAGVLSLLTRRCPDFVAEVGEQNVASSRAAAARFAMLYRTPRSALATGAVAPGRPVTSIVVFAEPGQVRRVLEPVPCRVDPVPATQACVVTSRGSCKAAALARLLALDFNEPDLSRAISFGDSPNDRCLLRASGHGIAVMAADPATASYADCQLQVPLSRYLGQIEARLLAMSQAIFPCEHT